MAAKPTDLFGWVATGQIESPSSGKKAIGWRGSERLPAQNVNYVWQLLTQWIAYLNEFETEPHTWTAIQTFSARALFTGDANFAPDVITQNAPIVEFANVDGDVNSFIDANGLPGGYHLDFEWAWNNTNITFGAAVTDSPLIEYTPSDPEVMISTAITGGTAQVVSGNDFPASPTSKIEMAQGTTTDQRSVIHSTEMFYYETSVNADQGISTLEFMAVLGNVGASIGVNHYFGWHSSPGSVSGSADYNAAGSFSYANFRKENADINWQVAVADGTSETIADTGVAPSDELQRFRIEFHGRATPRGIDNSNVGVVIFFIDGVEVAEITTTIPAAFSAKFGAQMNTDGITPGGSRFFYLFPVRGRFAPYGATADTLS